MSITEAADTKPSPWYVLTIWLYFHIYVSERTVSYSGAGKSLVRPTSHCILFDVENISFDASLVIYTNSTNIPPITSMIITRIYEHQNLLSL